jgi:tripartite-type tricarboxylate transporter receptor subunit TctC
MRLLTFSLFLATAALMTTARSAIEAHSGVSRPRLDSLEHGGTYAGDAPAVSALLGDHVASVLFTYAAVAAQVSAGKLRVLATVSRERIAQLPDVPTIAESGFGEIEADGWYGLFAPARTPIDMIAGLASWFTTALQAPEIKAKLAVLGHEPIAMCGAEFAAYLHKKFEEYGRVIREASIKAE